MSKGEYQIQTIPLKKMQFIYIYTPLNLTKSTHFWKHTEIFPQKEHVVRNRACINNTSIDITWYILWDDNAVKLEMSGKINQKMMKAFGDKMIYFK